MNPEQAFPLSWPPGWPRTAATSRMVAPFFTMVKINAAWDQARASFGT